MTSKQQLLPISHTDVVVGDRILAHLGYGNRIAVDVESITVTDTGARVVYGRRLQVNDLNVSIGWQTRVAVLRDRSTISRLAL